MAGGALVTVGAFAAGPAAAVAVLNLMGFSSAGPVAGKPLSSYCLNGSLIDECLGSLAALVQSIVYGGEVGPDTLFAICQRAVMGGINVGSPAQIVAGVAALVVGARLLCGVRCQWLKEARRWHSWFKQ